MKGNYDKNIVENLYSQDTKQTDYSMPVVYCIVKISVLGKGLCFFTYEKRDFYGLRRTGSCADVYFLIDAEDAIGMQYKHEYLLSIK